MNTYRFDITPESTRGIGDGITDGDNPIKQILQAQATFALKFSAPPTTLVINPDDRRVIENNPAVLSISGGRLLSDDGRLVVLPFLTLRESDSVAAGVAALESEEYLG